MTSLVERFETKPSSTTTLWRIAAHKAAKEGDRVFLFKQGSGEKGIFGVGKLLERPQLQPDPTDIGGGHVYRVLIIFDQLVDPGKDFLLGMDELNSFVPDELFNTQSSGISVPEDVVAEIEKRLARMPNSANRLNGDQSDDLAFDPDSIDDMRERAQRAIRIRRGQPAFRAKLLEVYDQRCIITNCAVEDVLEAAHITSYLGGSTNDISNGLLLRTDLHTLFDCFLLAIDPEKRIVVIAETLQTSSYGKLAGRKIRSPSDPKLGPSRRNLEKRFAEYTRRLET